jgi:3-phosphoshikimate 1-carboxyvinyltransferase
LLDVLSDAGISFETDSGKFPLKISGSAKNNHLKIDASFSSQMLTGLLISAPLLQHNTVIHVMDVVSKPYIEMTLDIIKDFGVNIEHENFKTFHVSGNQHYIGREYEIEGDWSGASNFLVAAAISGEMTVFGLNMKSKQADRFIIDVLKAFGADVQFGADGVIVKKHQCLPFHIDATHCPDLFPPLAVLAAAARGTSVIKGIQRLVHKESNRLESIVEMMNALGGKVQISDAGMIIHGNGRLKGGTVNSQNDHRIVMAAAVAACISENPVQIIGAEAVRKSYPDFFEKMNGLF